MNRPLVVEERRINFDGEDTNVEKENSLH
jgi:hypothetical protein